MTESDFTTNHVPEKGHRRRLAEKYRLTDVPCPGCGWHRLIEVGHGIQVQTFRPGEPGYETAHLWQKCTMCKASIGIRKI